MKLLKMIYIIQKQFWIIMELYFAMIIIWAMLQELRKQLTNLLVTIIWFAWANKFVDFKNKGSPDRPPDSWMFFDFKQAFLSRVVLEIISPEIFCALDILIIFFNIFKSISGAILIKTGNCELVNFESVIPLLTATITSFRDFVSWKSRKLGVLGDDIFIDIKSENSE